MFLGLFSVGKFVLDIDDHQENKREEKGYEKDNLFGGYWFTFGFNGIAELYPGQNSHY